MSGTDAPIRVGRQTPRKRGRIRLNDNLADYPEPINGSARTIPARAARGRHATKRRPGFACLGLDTREGGQRLLAAIRQRKAGAVVLLKLDRGFRNATDCLSTVEQWEKAGVALHVVDLGGNAIDTTSAAGRFMLVVLAGAAEMERNLTRERTRSAMAVKRANGQRVGAVPYGSDLADDGVTLVPNESEQAVIADVKAMRARGMKLQQIAARLTERSVPTKTGKSRRWTHQAVARILNREAAG